MHRESSDVRLLYQQDGRVAVTSKNKRTGETYLALFNISERSPLELKVNLADLGLNGKVRVTDLWKGAAVGTFEKSFSQNFSAHASGLFKITSL